MRHTKGGKYGTQSVHAMRTRLLMEVNDMNHKGKTEHDPNTVWDMAVSRRMKEKYIREILAFSNKPHTEDELRKKNLNRLREIYEKEVG